MNSKTGEKELSVVIPLFNEEESLRTLHAEIMAACDPLGLLYEIIYVDDGSADGSFPVLESLYSANPDRVKVIQFRKNSGKSDALSAGFAAASGKRVVTMDADLQDDPSEIPGLLARLEDGFDLVSGWKKKRRDPISKKLPSRLFNAVTSLLTGIRIHDFNCGLKAYRREVLHSLEVYGELHRYIPVLAHWEGYRVGEVKVHHRARKYGKTKYGMSRFFKGPLDLLTVMFLGRYTRRPLHLFGIVGFITSMLGMIITVYLIVLRLTRVSYLSNRPLFFVGIMLILLGIQFISIGLLGEMITRSHASVHTYKIRRTLGA